MDPLDSILAKFPALLDGELNADFELRRHVILDSLKLASERTRNGRTAHLSDPFDAGKLGNRHDPGMIGTETPEARHRSLNFRKLEFSKNSWVKMPSAPASTLRFRFIRSTSRSAASGCFSG